MALHVTEHRAASESAGEDKLAGEPRLRELYVSELRPKLIERFGYKNVNQAPRLVKLCTSMGLGDSKGASDSSQIIEAAVREMSLIVGQRPCVTVAKKSIASFGVREGMPVGCRATVRGARAWEFLDRLLNIALPRIRDFRGLPRKSFDGRGNYSLGIDDHLIFPELSYDDVKTQRGMDITIVTTAPTDEEAMAFLEGLGMPLAREEGAS